MLTLVQKWINIVQAQVAILDGQFRNLGLRTIERFDETFSRLDGMTILLIKYSKTRQFYELLLKLTPNLLNSVRF